MGEPLSEIRVLQLSDGFQHGPPRFKALSPADVEGDEHDVPVGVHSGEGADSDLIDSFQVAVVQEEDGFAECRLPLEVGCGTELCYVIERVIDSISEAGRAEVGRLTLHSPRERMA